MTGMGRPKYLQWPSKWAWFGVLAWLIAGGIFADYISH